MTAKTLTFRLATSGPYARYRADGASHSYVATKDATGWELTVWSQDRSISDLVLLGERKDGTFTDRLRDARAIASEFEALGDDFASHEHGHRNRLTVAISNAYDAM
jgi:hypothetical protein